MTTKYGYRNGVLAFYDSASHERVLPVAPIYFKEDFLGVLNGDFWTVVDTGGATPIKLANQNGGIYNLPLSGAGELQEAAIYGKDALEFNIDKGPIFEWVVSLAVLPTDVVEIYFGASGAYATGNLVAADLGPLVHMCFMFDGSGICTIHTDDGTTSIDAIATGVTLTASATARHVFKIDCTTAADILFYIDGVRVGSAQTFDMSLGSLSFQPIAACYKASDTGVGILYLDTFRAWAKR
jgi:hypothetical protein